MTARVTWKTKVSEKPAMARTPFMRYRSSPRTWIRLPSQWFTCAAAHTLTSDQAMQEALRIMPRLPALRFLQWDPWPPYLVIF